jgi:outer membrane receptor protein involved in Fe transport
MQRSRKRKLMRQKAAWQKAQLATALLAATPVAWSQQAASGAGQLEEIVVTATKREETLQNVPLAITALGTEKLEQLHVTDFTEYAKFLPTVAFETSAPGFSRVFMRGVASGDNGNHSGSLPSVGVYLDEQPITTIQGALDLHIYDIARVESLAGPQGTLYGASSQAGTVRIITNKPDPSKFEAGYDVQGMMTRGEGGYIVEGFVNLPVGTNAAIRLVGWSEHDPGYIDNVAGTNVDYGILNGTRTFPTWCQAQGGSGAPGSCQVGAGAISNAAYRKSNYNTVETNGARAALRINLDDNWTITPTVMGQSQRVGGSFAYDPGIGELKLAHFFTDNSKDSWWQTALTVEGKIANFDVTYAGAYLKRWDRTTSDYSDYTFFYDKLHGSGAYFYDSAHNIVNPQQFIYGYDDYKKFSHELRIATPKDYPLRFVGGAFLQKQEHRILQDYVVPTLVGSGLDVTGWPGTLWLTDQRRLDRDRAVFGELTYDLTPQLSGTLGIRHFWAINSLEGFYGFGPGFSSQTGESNPKCALNPAGFNGAPCNDLPYQEINESGNTYKANLTYKITDNKLVYATWSRGFRPGGVNRRDTGKNGVPPFQQFPPYKADFLDNFEFGWKTTWLENTLRFNGAIYYQKWKDFQYSYLGPNAFTILTNAGGAKIKGIEGELEWAATRALTLSGGFAYTDAKLSQNFCKQLENGQPLAYDACPDEDKAADGQRLPVTPKFKANVTARYAFDLGGGYDSHVQGSVVYVGQRLASLLPFEQQILGDMPAYTLLDLSAGIGKDGWTAELFVNNATDKRAVLTLFAQCGVADCGAEHYIVPATPRTIGIKFGQRF